MDLKNDIEWNRRLRKSSRPQMFFKIIVLKNFVSFTGKHLCWRLINLIKKKLQHRCFPVNIVKLFKSSFFIDHLRWLFLGTGINRIYSEKYLLQNSKDNMRRNSDMMLYALQLKQKSTAGVSCEILEQLLSRIIFGTASEKKTEDRKMQSDPCGFRFLLFAGHIIIKSWNNYLYPFL